MAKWGEGDQRWIVNDHGGQGRNVGSWHWEEKNRMEWTKDRLSQLLEGLSTPQPTTDGPAPPAVATIKTVAVKGTAFTTRRKGNKVAAIHDLNLTIDWQATSTKNNDNDDNDDGITTTNNNNNTIEEDIIKGQIIITEFVSGCDVDDAEFSVSVTGTTTAAHDAVKTKVAAMKDEIFKLLEQYAVELAALEEEEEGGES